MLALQNKKCKFFIINKTVTVDNESFEVFGVLMKSGNTQVVFDDVSDDRDALAEFIDTLNKNDIPPETLGDLVEDFVLGRNTKRIFI